MLVTRTSVKPELDCFSVRVSGSAQSQPGETLQLGVWAAGKEELSSPGAGGRVTAAPRWDTATCSRHLDPKLGA